MVRARVAARGYLIPVLSICVAIVTIGFLSLSLHSAKSEDRTEERRASLSAFYAAESGPLLAEHTLVGKKMEAPPTGVWLTGELPKSQSRYRIEISNTDYSKEAFTLRASGQCPGEQGVLVHSEITARVRKDAAQGWKVEWRKRQ